MLLHMPELALMWQLIPSWNTLVRITKAYSCIVTTSSGKRLITLSTTSAFLFSRQHKIEGKASELAFGLCFSNFNTRFNERLRTELLRLLRVLYKCCETFSNNFGFLLLM